MYNEVSLFWCWIYWSQVGNHFSTSLFRSYCITQPIILENFIKTIVHNKTKQNFSQCIPFKKPSFCKQHILLTDEQTSTVSRRRQKKQREYWVKVYLERKCLYYFAVFHVFVFVSFCLVFFFAFSFSITTADDDVCLPVFLLFVYAFYA